MANTTIDRSNWLRIDDPRGFTTYLNPDHPMVLLGLALEADFEQMSLEVNNELIASGLPFEQWNRGDSNMAYIEVTSK